MPGDDMVNDDFSEFSLRAPVASTRPDTAPSGPGLERQPLMPSTTPPVGGNASQVVPPARCPKCASLVVNTSACVFPFSVQHGHKEPTTHASCQKCRHNWTYPTP